jgi:hypothetical protein
MTDLVGNNIAVSASKKPPVYNHSIDTELSEEHLARRFMRPAKLQQDIQYEFTRDPGLLHQYFRLREDMFISVWGLKHFSGQHDGFDDISDIMIARKGLQCIAGGRLTVSSPSNPQPMPMEKEDFRLKDIFAQLDLPETTYGEFSRLAILPEFRAGAVFPEIARRFIQKAVSNGVEYAFNLAPVPLARGYRQAVQLFGLKWDIRHDIKVPEREEYEGIQMVVSIMDLSLLVRNSKAIREESQQNRQKDTLVG